MTEPTRPTTTDDPPLWDLGDLLTVATGRVFYGTTSDLDKLLEHLTGCAVSMTAMPDACAVARDHVRAHLPCWEPISQELPDDDDAPMPVDAARFIGSARTRWGARHPMPPMPDQSWRPPHPMVPLARIGSGLPGYRPARQPLIGLTGGPYDYLRETAQRLHAQGRRMELVLDLARVADLAESSTLGSGSIPGLALANYVRALDQAGHDWLPSPEDRVRPGVEPS